MALTAAEERQLVRLLDKTQWPLPKPIFEALMRTTISVPIELGVFSIGSFGLLEVLMFQRPEDDKEFPPGSWHMPGTVVRNNENISGAMHRLCAQEVGGLERTTYPRSCGFFEVESSSEHPRHAVSLLYHAWLQTPGNFNKDYDGPGRFFPIDNLPENTLKHHLAILQQMLKRRLKRP